MFGDVMKIITHSQYNIHWGYQMIFELDKVSVNAIVNKVVTTNIDTLV